MSNGNVVFKQGKIKKKGKLRETKTDLTLDRVRISF